MTTNNGHAAAPSALGFYYQSFFALRALISLTGDGGAVAVERADDVELKDNGQLLLFQLKHSMKDAPSAITVSSRALWRTLKAWIDILPGISLPETLFHLVTVGPISNGDTLNALKSEDGDRTQLVADLVTEAERVIAERRAADTAKKKLPHGDRASGCEAFLKLSPDARLNLVRQIRIQAGSITIDQMEGAVAEMLTLIKPEDRATVARRLIEWWDRQVVYSLCEKRPKFISRAELQAQISEEIADVEHDKITADFETVAHPSDYQPDGMLTRQIALVGGKSNDLARAIREEWKARRQRSKWVVERPGMSSKVAAYDDVLKEFWSDQHLEIVDLCLKADEIEKRAKGLALLRWSHNEAHRQIRPITPGFEAPYYVRGSYQVLAIDREVGWHPDYLSLLDGDDE